MPSNFARNKGPSKTPLSGKFPKVPNKVVDAPSQTPGGGGGEYKSRQPGDAMLPGMSNRSSQPPSQTP